MLSRNTQWVNQGKWGRQEEGKVKGERGRDAQSWPGYGVVEGGGNAAAMPKVGSVVVW